MRYQNAQRNFAFGALLVGIAALCLQIIGVVSPTWNVVEGKSDYTIQEGVWFAVAVPPKYKHNDYRVASSSTWIFQHFGKHANCSVLEDVRWHQFRIMTLCGLMGSLNAVLAAAVIFARHPLSASPFVVGLGLLSSLAACSLIFIPVLKVSMLISNSTVIWGMCWARLTSLIGCIVQFVCAVLYVFLGSQTCMSLIGNKSDEDEENSGVVFEPDDFDSPVENIVNPGLELPAYCDLHPEPPPNYTELPDEPSQMTVSCKNEQTQT